MKRKHSPEDQNDSQEHRPSRKRFSRLPPSQEPLPCKFKLLRQWELTQEVSRYLQVKNQIEEHTICDRTASQWALVPYSPNKYQQIIDDIRSASYFQAESMDIQGVEVYGS